MSKACLLLALGCLAAFQMVAQGERATARGMYFAGFDEPAEPSASAPSSTPAPSRRKTVPVAPKPKVTEPLTTPTPIENQRSNQTSRPAVIQNVSRKTGLTPLGLRYSVLRVLGAESKEVAPTTSFRSGDRIQMKIQSNDDGYLYVVHLGTSGDWSVVFPYGSHEAGSNKIVAGKDYLIPPTSVLRFSGDPGVERLFVCLSREPELSLDELIFALRNRTESGPGQPAAAEKAPSTMMAKNLQIGNPLIDHLRTATSRDLVLETVDSDQPEQQEHAVYVVNPSRLSGARVVADISLTHK
jgi:hypothetical protein